jgi:hypothetical protein
MSSTQFFQELKSRWSSPSPEFWKVITKFWKIVFSISTAIAGLTTDQIGIAQTLMSAGTISTIQHVAAVIMLISTVGGIQSQLTKVTAKPAEEDDTNKPD